MRRQRACFTPLRESLKVLGERSVLGDRCGIDAMNGLILGTDSAHGPAQPRLSGNHLGTAQRDHPVFENTRRNAALEIDEVNELFGPSVAHATLETHGTDGVET